MCILALFWPVNNIAECGFASAKGRLRQCEWYTWDVSRDGLVGIVWIIGCTLEGCHNGGGRSGSYLLYDETQFKEVSGR